MNLVSASSIRNILILRPGAIGDTLLTFPSFRLLRRQFPLARITVVGNRAALCLARSEGFVDAIDAFGADWMADLFGDEPTTVLRERLALYDLAIVWMHSPEAAADLAGRLEKAGVRRTLPLVSFPEPGSGRHVADHLVDTLAVLGIDGPRPALTLGVPRWHRMPGGLLPPLPTGEGEGEGRSILEAPGAFLASSGNGSPLTLTLSRGERGIVVFHPGAGARRKRWPAEKFARLGDRLGALGYSLAVTSGPADEEAVGTLRAALPNPPQILAGLELADLAAVLSRASLVVGNDSGVTHLAALIGAPTLALFGPFDPVYWAPIGPHVSVVDAGRSCSHRQDPREGCRQCDLLAALAVDQVWEAAAALLDPPSAD